MSDFTKKILIVEDDNLLRTVLMEQLALTYSVIPSADGQEALQQVKLFHPNIILLDLLLPKMDGFEFLKALRQLPDPKDAQTEVIVISNLTDMASLQNVLKLGVKEYFTKAEVDMGILKDRIQKLLKYSQ